LAGRLEAKRTSLKTGHYAIEKRLGGSIFLETKRVAAKRENSFAQRVCFRCVAVPRNESQHFRPAGTRVALPGTNRRSSRSESSKQDFFPRFKSSESLSCNFSQRKILCEKNLFLRVNREEASVEILRCAQDKP
jgi:hypothetical protein